MEVTGRRSVSRKDMILCKPCVDDNNRVPANGLCRECEEHMCIACFGNHKKYKMCKDHSMLDIDTKVDDTYAVAKETNADYTKEESYENCLEHINEQMKFFCVDHEDVGCGDCMITQHKTCKVEYVRDKARNFKDSKEFNDVVKRVDACQKAVDKCSTSISNNKIQVDDINQGFLDAMKSFRDEITTHLDKLEEDLAEKANNAKATDTLHVASLEASCGEIERELSGMSDDIDSSTNEPNKLFNNALRCKKALQEVERKLEMIKQTNRISNYLFKRNGKLENMLEQAELGTMEEKKEKEPSEPDKLGYEVPISSQDLKDRPPVYEDCAHTPTSKDYEQLIPSPTRVRTKSTISDDCASIISKDDYEPIYSEIAERKLSQRRASSNKKHWSLFENQLRCENLLMAGESISFKENDNCDIGLFVGKRSLKTGTYFEVEITSTNEIGNIGIGFIPKDYPLKDLPGDGRFSIGIHAKDGCVHNEGTSGERISPPCRIGDVIGIGVSSFLTNVFKTKISIFFTKNGKKIGKIELNNPSFCKLFPAVGLSSFADSAKVILDAEKP